MISLSVHTGSLQPKETCRERQSTDCVSVCVQAAAEEKPAWSALRDDFMMGATMKDWDKDSDGDEAEGDAQAGRGAEESDSD